MSRLTNENVVPTIMLLEQQAIVSEAVANSFRTEFKRHTILQCGENFEDAGNFNPDLKLIVVTKSMLLTVYEKSKKIDFMQNCFGSVPIALLGDEVDKSALEFLERHNLKGVFPDETPTHTLIAGLKFILEGGQYFPRKINRLKEFYSLSSGLDAMIEDGAPGSMLVAKALFEAVDPFTKRERAVLHCLAKGQPNKVIAGKLEIAENTIKIHIRNILKKLSVSNRTEAVLAAHKMSLIDLH
jgi:DNA-binding NarL/FixJ family response regulator